MSRIRSAAIVSAILLGGVAAWTASTAANSVPSSSPAIAQELGEPVQYSATTVNGPRATLNMGLILQTKLDRRPADTDVLRAELSPDSGVTNTARQLHLDVSAGNFDKGGAIRAFWEGSLLQGAIAEDLATGSDTSTGVSSGVFAVHLQDGTVKELAAGAGKVVAGQVFARLDGAGQQRVSGEIVAVAASFGLRVASTKFVSYRDDAVAIVAEVRPGGSLRDFESLRVALTGSPARYEGVYLEVRDSSGTPIAISATAFRSGAGVLWVDPALSGRIGEVERRFHG